MTSPRIVLHPAHPASVGEAFRAEGDLDVVIPERDDVRSALEGADVLVGWRWDDAYLVPSLQWIQAISAGVDQFPKADLASAGVVLTSARGCHGPQVSEHAFALLLALTRGVGASMRNAERRSWKPIPGVEISGLTLGVLGLGTIGEEIARKGAAWGMRVIGTKGDPSSYEGVAEWVVGPDRTIEVFEGSDAVISVLPDLPETRGLVTRECLDALSGGWFVNVGRGTVVAEGDIVGAIEDGSLLGAGLDVFEIEPLPEDSPLWANPRVVLTPHSGGLSPHYGERLMKIFRHNLRAFRGGGDWLNREA